MIRPLPLKRKNISQITALQKDFDRWLDGLNDRYEVKEVIFDGFTPSGERKYIPNTLENVSRFMKKEGLMLQPVSVLRSTGLRPVF